MSPTLLRLLAGLLVIVAAVLAVIGWRISQQPEPAPAVQAPVSPEALAPREPEERQAPSHAVVVAARDLALGQRLDPEAEPGALRLVAYPEPVPGSFAELEALAGRRLTRPVPEGEILRPRHFSAGGVMAQAVPAGKRAVAVGVDEVIGGGGFLAPGDRVDILYQARAGDGDQPQLARRLFANVQVVSYGESLQGAEEEEETVRRSGRTAVLALEGEQAAALMLAETTGRLRLALIGAEEHRGLIEREAQAREAAAPEAAPDGVIPAMAGLPQPAPAEAEPAAPASPLPALGPAVLFNELTVLDAATASGDEPAPRRPRSEEAPTRRVIQHVGGEVRVVELPQSR
ncbi:Flp pilus assembly protein CpaB [uncultured Halomonas sp.]|uniref:Flp pilus assembly protein CpaB n=1 Tax=uncultured Halomonas sp. TaxID=173971 RepID=UPI0026380787|nr:Flp pilus assembly protein CpaB [uncultured Halomonas sp.]